ncbi:MAG: hypothetical protein HGA23_03905, partial [Bacteroidales bacterium]|nr:hypothetical protein [Bacteroidales bacterium]
MVDLKVGTAGSSVKLVASAQTDALDDGAVLRLLAAEDVIGVVLLGGFEGDADQDRL